MAVPRVLVYGGKGALGSAVVNMFKTKNWWVCSVDLFECEAADCNVTLTPTDSWTSQAEEVSSKVDGALGDSKVDAIVCVAGGWAGGNAASNEYVKNCDLMWKQSVWTSVLASQIAAKHLNSGGFLLLTGAKAGLEGTPGMIGYGMAKAAVHQLVASLSQPKSGMPENSSVVAILPVTLNTPANRKAMPNADFAQWTPLDELASRLVSWSAGEDRPPPSTNLLQVVTVDGVTTYTPVN
ncbi:dihydropteridine reductase-like [Halichondria panicea]|uniref:dihydropteridine reductase-like n=1 Tax=Halichondria panicea TaxID=6063 RepID=UPI00312B83A7